MAESTALAREIGERLRALRKARGQTLRELADKAGISEALLSRIERGQVATTVANLVSLTAGLGVSLSSVLEPAAQTESEVTYSLTRAKDLAAEAPLSVEGYAYHALCLGMPSPLSPLLVSYARGMPEGWLRHPGHELLFVVSGRLRFELGEQSLELGAGDCLLFDSRVPHRAESLGKEPARTLMVLAGAEGEREVERHPALGRKAGQRK